jgi:hypothetical protein
VRVSATQLDAILRTHCVDPALLRSDEFDGFFQERKAALPAVVERAMGKQAIVTSEPLSKMRLKPEAEAWQEVAV